MKKLFLFALTFCALFSVSAQNELPKSLVFTGVSYGYSKDLKVLSMPVAISHSIAGNPHFRYIAGIRQSLAYGASEFTFNGEKAWIDDLSNYSMNIMGGLEYVSDRKISVGFNTDIIGGTVGTRSFKTVGKDPVYTVSPEGLNVLFGGGSLNSEFYVGYQLSPSVTAKIGMTHYNLGLVYSNTETPSTTSGTFINLAFIHLQYTLWKK
jgi:hypothetical protein